jgi:hypothetical protein
VDELAKGLNLTENTGRSIDVGNGDELVFLFFKGLLDLVQLRAVSNGSLELSNLDTVCLETIGEAVGKVTSVQDQNIITRLSQVGSNLVPKGCDAGSSVWKSLRSMVKASPNVFTKGAPT